MLYAAFVSSLHKIVGVEFGKSHIMNLTPELNYSFFSFYL